MGILDNITDEDLRKLAALVSPILKSDATQVGKLPVVESLEGVNSIPAVQQLSGVRKAVSVPISALKGLKGDIGEKGDSFKFNIIGKYDNLIELQATYPEGPTEEGFFLVGDKAYTWVNGAFSILNLDAIRAFNQEQFYNVLPENGNIIIDYSKTPYASVKLTMGYDIFNLQIKNAPDGAVGKILIYQIGYKQISTDGDIKGKVSLPNSNGTIALLTYQKILNTIYIFSTKVIDDAEYPTPEKIIDFQLVYSDTSICAVQWTAPDTSISHEAATSYDIRYSSNLVDANDITIWNSLTKVSGIPTPSMPGTLERMTISNLKSNQEYYIYIKSKKVTDGITHISESSDFIFFKTK